jgi:CDP-diacylglycerol--glycerol-3-phosphate 3-phosphatidyltransferase
VFRVLLAPALVALILADRKDPLYVAAGIFVVGAATDGLDGYVARRSATTTRTGQWLDPLADKVLVAAPILALASLGRFPWWAAVIIVARELFVSGLRVVLGLRGRSLPASRGAKVKTTLQILAITLYILPLGSGADGIKLAFLVAALAMTVSTGAQYVAEAARWTRRVDRALPPDGAGPE